MLMILKQTPFISTLISDMMTSDSIILTLCLSGLLMVSSLTLKHKRSFWSLLNIILKALKFFSSVFSLNFTANYFNHANIALIHSKTEKKAIFMHLPTKIHLKDQFENFFHNRKIETYSLWSLIVPHIE